MKAADQGLVEKMSFRFLITGEEDDVHQQPRRSKYFNYSRHVTLFIGHTSKQEKPINFVSQEPISEFEKFCSISEIQKIYYIYTF